MKRIFVIHGPNLGKLAYRDPHHYGGMSLEDLYQGIMDAYPDLEFTFYQSNHEGDLIDVILDTLEHPYDAILINPGALTHTSISLRDALEMIKVPKAQVHLSDLSKREPFRQVNYINDVVDGSFMGKKLDSYIEAIQFLMHK